MCIKCASFCWNVEYVESCWIQFSKKCVSAEKLNMLNMLNYFGSMESQKGPHRPKIIQHIQHFSRKRHFFRKRHSTWSNIFNISAERSIFLKKNASFWGGGVKFNMAQKVALSAEKIQHGPKSGPFSRKNSTWADNVCLSSKKVSFQVLFCFLLFSVSLSLSVPQIPSSSALLHLCVSHSLTLSLSLSLSLPSFLYLLLPPLSVPRLSSITLSFLLTFSVLGSDLG